MDAIDDFLNVVIGVGDLAGKHTSFARLSIMWLAVRREWMAALGAVGVSACDQCVTLFALLGRRHLIFAFVFFLGFDLVNRSVAFDVATKVEDQAILFIGVQPETTSDTKTVPLRRPCLESR